MKYCGDLVCQGVDKDYPGIKIKHQGEGVWLTGEECQLLKRPCD